MTTTAQNIAVPRITVHTTKSFSDTIEKLFSSIGRPEDAGWIKVASGIKNYNAESKEEFISNVKEYVGPHGFMIFQEYNHGHWLPFYLPTRFQVKRIILGNPLIAITMLEHDSSAGLCVPVELLVQEKDDGGTDLVYFQPSALISGGKEENEGLVKAAKALDGKFESLVQWVASD